LENILDYLEQNWTEREIDKFKRKLSHQLETICRFPFIFPQSEHQKRLRKAVLDKHITVFYEIKYKNIFIAYIFGNRQSISRIR